MDPTPTPFLERIKTFWGKEYNLLILAAGVGVLAGVASTVFRWMIDFFDRVFSQQGILFGFSDSTVAMLLPLMPMVGGLLIGLAWKFLPQAMEANGVHNVIEAMAMNEGKVPKSSIVTCAAASAITIGSGGSAGRVAPTVQICSAIGSLIGQIFRLNPERLRIFAGCGAAAGIAATFNAPLAGVIFAMEIILGHYTIGSFSPIVIAAVLGTVTGRAIEGNALTFQTPVHELVSYWEIFWYLLLGILCGLAARLFTALYFKTHDLFEKNINIPIVFKPALGGLVVGLLAIWVPEVKGNGFPVMEDALNGNLGWGLALTLVIAKMFATSVTLGSRGIGGIFAPSLFVGAMVGAVFGTAAHGMFSSITATHETYALVGMAALASAMLAAPLTAILIVFEMTNDYTIILPVMVCCIVATYTARIFDKNSLYVQMLVNEGVNLRHGKVVSVLNTIYVREVMSVNVITIPEDAPFEEILKSVSYSRNLCYPVVDTHGHITGLLSFSEIRQAALDRENESPDSLKEVTARELARKEFATLVPHNNLHEALDKFAEMDWNEIPVVGVSEPKKVVGLLNRSNVEAVYNREMLIQDLER